MRERVHFVFTRLFFFRLQHNLYLFLSYFFYHVVGYEISAKKTFVDKVNYQVPQEKNNLVLIMQETATRRNRSYENEMQAPSGNKCCCLRCRLNKQLENRLIKLVGVHGRI